jgi:hypothetical protein
MVKQSGEFSGVIFYISSGQFGDHCAQAAFKDGTKVETRALR